MVVLCQVRSGGRVETGRRAAWTDRGPTGSIGFAVFEKFAGIFGPAMFWLANMAFGSSRPAILAVTAFFLGGGVLLARVDVEPGQPGHGRARQ
jgi:hypothetical protein